jgi:hypothetical protein
VVPGAAEVDQRGPSVWLVMLTGDHDLFTLLVVDAAFQRIRSRR